MQTGIIVFVHYDNAEYYKLELKPIVVAIQWALVRTYWIDEPLE